MPNPNPPIENLTRAGKGAPPKPDKIKIHTTIDKSTKSELRRIGRIGDAIDRIYREWSERGLEIERLQRECEALRDRLRGLSPTDLP